MRSWRQKTTVLVVEDDWALRDLYKNILTVAGFAATAVEDGLDALRRIERELPNAIVLDLMLPRLSGRDLQREMASRAETRDIPIVVVTGTDATDLGKPDVACVLRKPVVPTELVFAVENALRRVRAPRSTT